MIWTVHEETEKFWEYHECEVGRVELIGLRWSACVFLPSHVRDGTVWQKLVGECYKSPTSARKAVENAYRKHMALNAE
jgi:hypothetical protein